MSSILDQIVACKKLEVDKRKKIQSLAELENQVKGAGPVRNFSQALAREPGVAIIAEVKKASPSAGVIRPDFDPVKIAQIYANHGAAAISVLTDAPFFQGELEYLSAIRQAVDLPLLRKDFIIDPYQLVEARLAGADAVLLIAEILPGDSLKSLLAETHSQGLQALVEVYEKENLSRAVNCGAKMIGINNRNLKTFETRLEHTLELASEIPPGCLLVSESGIRNRADLERLQKAGVKAVLVGETFMRSPDIGAKLDEMRGNNS